MVGKNILIVDDEAPIREMIVVALEMAGYECLEAENTQQAHAIIVDRKPDLILLDINLPGKSGIDACQEISDHELFCDIPIIIISGADHLDGWEAAFTAGASDYNTKPPSHTELLARIRSALRLKTEMNQRKAREEDLLVLNDRLAEVNRELERLSTTDSLTGLANRRSFNEFLSREWLREQREQKPFSVIMIDIDHFKKYNDAYGHLEGDVCLQKVSLALQRALCRAGALLARYGGEEFLCLLPETDHAGAELVAQHVLESIRAANIPHTGSEFQIVTVSIGLACVPANTKESQTDWLKKADAALYEAKCNGRNRIVDASKTVR